MSNTRGIYRDEVGPYVKTGGYVFRPPAAGTNHDAKMKVSAHHIGGTTFARVGGEEWRSYYSDPRYIEYSGINTAGSVFRPHYDMEWAQCKLAATLNRETAEVSGNQDGDEEGCP